MEFLGAVSSYFHKKGFENLSSDERIGLIDKGAMRILRAFHEDGFEAFIVGGCVRDLMMKLEPHDWDITTSALPDETIRVAESRGWKAIGGEGRRFGTAIIVIDGMSYEVTTFRSETYGQDAHRPSEVHFASDLKEDLMRRDFTVNAMAVDADGVIYDYFDGVSDLDRKRLCTVGESSKRFSEDALRLFRACRFLGQLDFMADRSLIDGMPSAFERVKGLSLERVESEIDRLIVTPHAARGFDLLVRTGLNECFCHATEYGKETEIAILPELSHLVGLPQQKEFHKFDGWYHTLAVLDASKPLLINRWAALLHDVGKGMPGVRGIHKGRLTDYGHDKKGAEMTRALLKHWKRPKAFVNRVTWLVENHMRFHTIANDPKSHPDKWIRQIAREKAFPTSADVSEAMLQMTDLSIADIIGCGNPDADTRGHQEIGEYMSRLALEIPVSTKELHYDKRVPLLLGEKTPEGMKNLLIRVQSGSLENEPAAIYDAAVRYMRRRSHE